MKTHIETPFGSFPVRTACPASAGYKQHESDAVPPSVLMMFTKPADYVGDVSYHIIVNVCKNCGSLYGIAQDQSGS